VALFDVVSLIEVDDWGLEVRFRVF